MNKERIAAIIMLPANLAVTYDLSSKVHQMIGSEYPESDYFVEPVGEPAIEVPDGFTGFLVLHRNLSASWKVGVEWDAEEVVSASEESENHEPDP